MPLPFTYERIFAAQVRSQTEFGNEGGHEKVWEEGIKQVWEWGDSSGLIDIGRAWLTLRQ